MLFFYASRDETQHNGNLLHTFSRDWQHPLVYLRYVHAGLIQDCASRGWCWGELPYEKVENAHRKIWIQLLSDLKRADI